MPIKELEVLFILVVKGVFTDNFLHRLTQCDIDRVIALHQLFVFGLVDTCSIQPFDNILVEWIVSVGTRVQNLKLPLLEYV